MGRRFVLLWALVGVLVAGCGSGAGIVHRRPAHAEAFSSNHHIASVTGWVVRTVDGVRFLVPARLDPTTTDFIHPGSVNVAPDPPFPSRTTPPGFDASTDAEFQRPYHVEVLATGPAGRRVDIAWEETCGLVTGDDRGGEGQQRARLPAILAVKLPQWSTGVDACYVTSTVLTSHFERGLSVELVNY